MVSAQIPGGHVSTRELGNGEDPQAWERMGWHPVMSGGGWAEQCRQWRGLRLEYQ